MLPGSTRPPHDEPAAGLLRFLRRPAVPARGRGAADRRRGDVYRRRRGPVGDDHLHVRKLDAGESHAHLLRADSSNAAPERISVRRLRIYRHGSLERRSSPHRLRRRIRVHGHVDPANQPPRGKPGASLPVRRCRHMQWQCTNVYQRCDLVGNRRTDAHASRRRVLARQRERVHLGDILRSGHHHDPAARRLGLHDQRPRRPNLRRILEQRSCRPAHRAAGAERRSAGHHLCETRNESADLARRRHRRLQHQKQQRQ